MKYSSKVSANNRSNQDLSNVHIMTHNFGNMDIVRCQYMVPGDKMRFDVSAFTRLTPLPCPTFSNLRMVLRAFCVPIDFVIRDFSKYLSDDYVYDRSGQSILSVPYVRPIDILSSFITLDLVEDAGVNRPDFSIIKDNDDSRDEFVLTSVGRRVRSFLLQLGYKLPHVFAADSVTLPAAASLKAAQTEQLSMIPLMAFFKFYTDWVVPARFVDTNFFGVLKYLGQHYSSNTVFSDGASGIADYGFNYTGSSANNLSDFLGLLPAVSFLFDDYYTSAFKTAYGPENSSFSGVSGLDVVFSGSGNSSTVKNPVIASNYDGMPVVETGNTTGVRNLSSLQLLSLGRLQKLVNDKKLTDSHVLEWLKLTYGISPSKDALQMSDYLDMSASVIQIGDIMATATTDSTVGTTVVGQYAGKGLGGMSATWSKEVDKHSLFFITCELQTKTSYVQGLDPFMKCLKREHFFLPEFDNVGVRAIAHRELIFDTFDTDADVGQAETVPAPDSIFGFAPRYSEFKRINDMVSGDFCNTSVNVDLDSWYLSRKYGITDDPKINLDFCSASNRSVGSQYDRIFQNTNDIDHFYTVFNVGCKANRPMASITDYFEDIDDTKGSKSIDVENNNVIG